MSQAFAFEDFSRPRGPEPSGPTEQAAGAQESGNVRAAAEKAHGEGYETGYQAGWDDATHAAEEERRKFSADFSRNLQDLGFTFHEARQHVINSLEPLLSAMLDKVLPELAQRTIGETLIEELMALAAETSNKPIQILVSPADHDKVETMLADAAGAPFELETEPALAEGQIFLRSGNIERSIDLATTLERMKNAIEDLYKINGKAFQHG